MATSAAGASGPRQPHPAAPDDEPKSVADLLTAAGAREASLLAQLAAARTEHAKLLWQKREADRVATETIERLHASVLEVSATASSNDSGSSGAPMGGAGSGSASDASEAAGEKADAGAAKAQSLRWFRDQIAARDAAVAELEREVKELRAAVEAARGDAAAAGDRAAAAEESAATLQKAEAAAAHAKAAHARVAADRNSYKRKLESLQKDTRKLIASKLQIERGLQELRGGRETAAQLATAEASLYKTEEELHRCRARLKAEEHRAEQAAFRSAGLRRQCDAALTRAEDLGVERDSLEAELAATKATLQRELTALRAVQVQNARLNHAVIVAQQQRQEQQQQQEQQQEQQQQQQQQQQQEKEKQEQPPHNGYNHHTHRAAATAAQATAASEQRLQLEQALGHTDKLAGGSEDTPTRVRPEEQQPAASARAGGPPPAASAAAARGGALTLDTPAGSRGGGDDAVNQQHWISVLKQRLAEAEAARVAAEQERDAMARRLSGSDAPAEAAGDGDAGGGTAVLSSDGGSGGGEGVAVAGRGVQELEAMLVALRAEHDRVRNQLADSERKVQTGEAQIAQLSRLMSMR